MSKKNHPEREAFTVDISDQERIQRWLIWLLIVMTISVNASLLPLSYRSNEELAVELLHQLGYQPRASEIHLTQVNSDQLTLILNAIVLKSQQLPPHLVLKLTVTQSTPIAGLNFSGFPYQLVITSEEITVIRDDSSGSEVTTPQAAIEYLALFSTFPEYTVTLEAVDEDGRIQSRDSIAIVLEEAGNN